MKNYVLIKANLFFLKKLVTVPKPFELRFIPRTDVKL